MRQKLTTLRWMFGDSLGCRVAWLSSRLQLAPFAEAISVAGLGKKVPDQQATATAATSGKPQKLPGGRL